MSIGLNLGQLLSLLGKLGILELTDLGKRLSELIIFDVPLLIDGIDL